MLSRQYINVAIIGGREFDDIKYATKSLMEVLVNNNIEFNTLAKDNEHITIVSGGARGADEIGKMISIGYNTKYKEFPAEWENLDKKPCSIKTREDGTKYNKLAGFNRNTDIINSSDIVIAFWDLDSNGTKDSLKKAFTKNKKVYIYYYE